MADDDPALGHREPVGVDRAQVVRVRIGCAAERAEREELERLAAELAALEAAEAAELAANYGAAAGLLGRTTWGTADLRSSAAELQRVFDAVRGAGQVDVVAHSAGGTAVDIGEAVGPVFRADPAAYCEDGFHPSADGYRLIAEALLPAVTDEILRIHAPLIASRRVTTRGVEMGGRAIEVHSGNSNANDRHNYALLAERHGLLAGAGSDFHRPGVRHLTGEARNGFRRHMAFERAAERGRDRHLRHQPAFLSR